MFCDMTDKSKVGVTTISHHSESRIYVGKSQNTQIVHLESSPLSWQHLLESRKIVNSWSGLSAVMMLHSSNGVMPGECHVMD